jgi:HPt (histidine-containing phosphotransfer) domain-containing protein
MNKFSIIAAVSNLISYTYLDEISGDDLDFRREILFTFTEEMPGEFDKIRLALDKGEWDLLGSLLHKIKAPVGMLCVEKVKQLLVKVEKNAKNGLHLEQLPADIHQLLTYLEACLVEIADDLR